MRERGSDSLGAASRGWRPPSARLLLSSLALLVAGSLAACAEDGFEPTLAEREAPPGSFPFVCENGVSFTVRFERDGEIAHLDAGGQSYALPQAISASGARYANEDGVEFWEHQGEATLAGAAGGPYESCRRG